MSKICILYHQGNQVCFDIISFFNFRFSFIVSWARKIVLTGLIINILNQFKETARTTNHVLNKEFRALRGANFLLAQITLKISFSLD